MKSMGCSTGALVVVRVWFLINVSIAKELFLGMPEPVPDAVRQRAEYYIHL